MSIHDAAIAAAHAVYDARITELEAQCEEGTIALSLARTSLASTQEQVRAARLEIETLKARIAELEAEKAPEGWATIYDSTFTANDGWSAREETQNNDLSFNTPRNVTFGDEGVTLFGRREQLGNRSFSSADITGKHIATPNYFRADVTATLPVDYGMWPCPLWFRPLTHGDDGEIDVCETWPFDWEKGAVAWATFWRDYRTRNKRNAGLPYADLPNPDPAAPHTYTVIKTEGEIEFLIDGVRVQLWKRGAKWAPAERISGLPDWYDSIFEIPDRLWYPRITLQIGGKEARDPKPEWQESQLTVHRVRIYREA